MFVKICGLSSAEQVQAAVDAGADAVGFVFADSVRRIDPADAAAISNTVPDTIKKVAVMLHPSNQEWEVVLGAFRPDVLQTDAGDFPGLNVPGNIECWPVFREGNKVTDTLLSRFVYEGPKSGQGETVDWAQAANVARLGSMILAGGLSASNVGEAIATVRPFGVDVSSAVESAPGEKDPDMIREFISAARAAESEL